LGIFVFNFQICFARSNPAFLNEINTLLANSTNTTDKINYYQARAKYYHKNNEHDKAIEDLTNALALEDKGFLRLDRAYVYYAIKQFKLTYDDAIAAKTLNPGLTAEANELIKKAENKLKQIELLENPPTIVMDGTVNLNRKTRMDVLRERTAAYRAIHGQPNLTPQAIKEEQKNLSESSQDSFDQRGACSQHKGVDWDAGPDRDGSVTCVDGWRDSSVDYYEEHANFFKY